jgi:phage gp29-like protein
MANVRLTPRQREEIAKTGSKTDPFTYGFVSADHVKRPRDPVLDQEANGRLDVYRDLERDSKVYACLQQRYNMTLNAETEIKVGLRRRGGERRRDRRNRDMVEAQIRTMGVTVDSELINAKARYADGFEGLQLGLLDALLMGFAVPEIMWARDGREVFVERVYIRKQTRFRFDGLDRLRLVLPGEGFTGRLLPPRKFPAFTFGSFYDPYGLALGNRLYWPVWFKRKGVGFWLRFLDKYGGPTALGRYRPGDKETQQDRLLEACQKIQAEGAAIIPDGQAIEFLQSITTAAQQGYDQLGRFLEGQIAQTVLGVTLTTEIRGEGSRAAAEVHSGKQEGVGVSDGRLISNFLTKTVSRWITDFNSGTEDPAPRLGKRFSNLSLMKAQAEIDELMFNIGYRRTEESVNEVYGEGKPVYEPVPKSEMGRMRTSEDDSQAQTAASDDESADEQETAEDDE